MELVLLVVFLIQKKCECEGLITSSLFERRAHKLVRLLGEDEQRSISPTTEARVLQRTPAGSRIQVSTTEAGTLEVLIPARRPGLDTALPAAFTLTWFGIVGVWTAGALVASPAFAAFSLPFWLAGARLASDTLIDPATSTKITIGIYAFEITTYFLGKTIRQIVGSTEDLSQAILITDGYINGEPVTSIRLIEGVNQHRIAGLAPIEIEWLCSLINDQISNLQEYPELIDRDDPYTDNLLIDKGQARYYSSLPSTNNNEERKKEERG
mmetsp:Transcript_20380/g.26420  ORF Transcript_20380/g.26420 Transcript_20380/m.26420 type:complete len:268 (+) Transcript_20380:90-893(+)